MIKWRIIPVLIVLLIPGWSYTQSLDSLQQDTIRWIDDWGIDIGGYLESGTASEYATLNGLIDGSIRYKNLKVGGFYSELMSTISEIVIFPNEYALDFQYGGFFVGYQIFDAPWFQGTLLVKNGYGDIIWSELESGDLRYREKMIVVHPEFELGISPFNLARLSLRSGYRWSTELGLPRVQALSGFTLTFGIKISVDFEDL